MKITARIDNDRTTHNTIVTTNGTSRSIDIPTREKGSGSGVNGGELLCLALATCFCNDIYREAAKRGMNVRRVEVDVEAEFGAEGEPGRNITYSAKIDADATDEAIRDLITHTDRVAEIHNTLRQPTTVTLKPR